MAKIRNPIIVGESVDFDTMDSLLDDTDDLLDELDNTLNGAYTRSTITNTLSGCSNSNTATAITNGRSYSGTITVDSGKEISSASITMNNVDITSTAFNSSTGAISIPNVSGNIVITITAVSIVVPYLTFSSPSSFTLSVYASQKGWDGTIEYSTDTTTWDTWNGTTISSGTSGNSNVLYLRGTGNTKISGGNQSKWILNGSNISCDGNIETLLDYATVVNGQHPPMASYCFSGLFYENRLSLIKAPDMPATTLSSDCYNEMYRKCASLISVQDLPATTLTYQCYSGMYQECTSLVNAPAIMGEVGGYESCRNMFNGCTALKNAPLMNITEFTLSAMLTCALMFNGCTNLEQLPSLPATTLVQYCYYYMFNGCTKIKVSETQTGEYVNAYRIPTANTGTDASNSMTDMFRSTGGTFTGTPTINTTYYTSNTIVGGN